MPKNLILNQILFQQNQNNQNQYFKNNNSNIYNDFQNINQINNPENINENQSRNNNYSIQENDIDNNFRNIITEIENDTNKISKEITNEKVHKIFTHIFNDSIEDVVGLLTDENFFKSTCSPDLLDNIQFPKSNFKKSGEPLIILRWKKFYSVKLICINQNWCKQHISYTLKSVEMKPVNIGDMEINFKYYYNTCQNTTLYISEFIIDKGILSEVFSEELFDNDLNKLCAKCEKVLQQRKKEKSHISSLIINASKESVWNNITNLNKKRYTNYMNKYDLYYISKDETNNLNNKDNKKYNKELINNITNKIIEYGKQFTKDIHYLMKHELKNLSDEDKNTLFTSKFKLNLNNIKHNEFSLDNSTKKNIKNYYNKYIQNNIYKFFDENEKKIYDNIIEESDSQEYQELMEIYSEMFKNNKSKNKMELLRNKIINYLKQFIEQNEEESNEEKQESKSKSKSKEKSKSKSKNRNSSKESEDEDDKVIKIEANGDEEEDEEQEDDSKNEKNEEKESSLVSSTVMDVEEDNNENYSEESGVSIRKANRPKKN